MSSCWSIKQCRHELHLIFDIIKMSLSKLSKLSGSDVELLIELWRNDRSLRDVTFPIYSSADERKASLSRISQQILMDGAATCKSVLKTVLITLIQPKTRNVCQCPT